MIPEHNFENEIPTLQSISLPFGGYVAAGFPSPASDYSEENIDLVRALVPHPLSTFYFRTVNDSMIDAHIPPGSILIVDKSLKPRQNSVVIASVDGEFLVKYFVKDRQGIRLVAANKKYRDLVITEGMDFSVWGVVTAVIIEKLKAGI